MTPRGMDRNPALKHGLVRLDDHGDGQRHGRHHGQGQEYEQTRPLFEDLHMREKTSASQGSPGSLHSEAEDMCAPRSRQRCSAADGGAACLAPGKVLLPRPPPAGSPRLPSPRSPCPVPRPVHQPDPRRGDNTSPQSPLRTRPHLPVLRHWRGDARALPVAAPCGPVDAGGLRELSGPRLRPVRVHRRAERCNLPVQVRARLAYLRLREPCDAHTCNRRGSSSRTRQVKGVDAHFRTGGV